MTHNGEHLIGFHQLLGVGHALRTIKAVVIVLEDNALALEAAGIVIGLEGSLHAGIEGYAHGGVGAGGGSGVAHKDSVVADTLHLYKGLIIAVGIVALAAAAHQRVHSIAAASSRERNFFMVHSPFLFYMLRLFSER